MFKIIKYLLGLGHGLSIGDKCVYYDEGNNPFVDPAVEIIDIKNNFIKYQHLVSKRCRSKSAIDFLWIFTKI